MFFFKVFSVSFQYLYNEKRKMQMWLIVLFILKLSAVYSWESPFMERILFLSWSIPGLIKKHALIDKKTKCGQKGHMWLSTRRLRATLCFHKFISLPGEACAGRSCLSSLDSTIEMTQSRFCPLGPTTLLLCAPGQFSACLSLVTMDNDTAFNLHSKFKLTKIAHICLGCV